MEIYRFRAKLDVHNRRVVWMEPPLVQTAGYYRPCDLCGGPQPSQLHEVWLSKADVRHTPEIWLKINAEPCNQVMLHPKCHVLAEKNRDRFRMILVDHYGKQRIIDWINSLGLKAPQEYIQAVLAVPDK